MESKLKSLKSFLEFKGRKMKLNKYIDHTLLKPEAAKEQIEK